CTEGHVTHDFMSCDPLSHCRTEQHVLLCEVPSTTSTSSTLIQEGRSLENIVNMFVCENQRGALHYTLRSCSDISATPDMTCREVVDGEQLVKGRDEEETAVKCLVTAASQGPLCVVVDEAYTDRVFTNFCAELCEFIPGLRLWAASVYHGNIPPCLTEVPMTEPLRTPPVVTRHVQQSDWIQKPNNHVRDYTTGPTPPPCDGPAPRVLYHTGQGHGEGSAVDCVECGKNVARVLRELHVSVA
ncbi:hypothetical protein BaRGS_00011780, partial [Batillaria attramentaria]